MQVLKTMGGWESDGNADPDFVGFWLMFPLLYILCPMTIL
jgi:hypothetical protein